MKLFSIKKTLLTILLLITVILTAACSSSSANVSEENYKLFPTQNYWTFLKLDTRNGLVKQVHFSINDDQARGEVVLNNLPLVDASQEKCGRFILYPTNNMYNFLLLDQISGKTWQIQWSFEEKNRGIIDEIK